MKVPPQSPGQKAYQLALGRDSETGEVDSESETEENTSPGARANILPDELRRRYSLSFLSSSWLLPFPPLRSSFHFPPLIASSLSHPKNLRIQHLGKELLLRLRFFRLFFSPGSLSSSLFPPCTSSSFRFPFLPLAPSLFLFASSVPQQIFASRISGKRRRKRAGRDSERANQGALVRRS